MLTKRPPSEERRFITITSCWRIAQVLERTASSEQREQPGRHDRVVGGAVGLALAAKATGELELIYQRTEPIGRPPRQQSARELERVEYLGALPIAELALKH